MPGGQPLGPQKDGGGVRQTGEHRVGIADLPQAEPGGRREVVGIAAGGEFARDAQRPALSREGFHGDLGTRAAPDQQIRAERAQRRFRAGQRRLVVQVGLVHQRQVGRVDLRADRRQCVQQLVETRRIDQRHDAGQPETLLQAGLPQQVAGRARIGHAAGFDDHPFDRRLQQVFDHLQHQTQRDERTIGREYVRTSF